MTQEDKDIVLKDLCGRLPYGVKIIIMDSFKYSIVPTTVYTLDKTNISDILSLTYKEFGKRLKKAIKERSEDIIIKPYLRPLSSMTEEEKKIMRSCGFELIPYYTDHTGFANIKNYIDEVSFRFMEEFLNAHHFDYRGLIPMGLALEAPDGMYMSYNEKHTDTDDIIKKRDESIRKYGHFFTKKDE